MKRFLSLVTILVLLATGAVTAQPMRLTLGDAMNLALQNNRELQIAKLEVEKSDYRVGEALGNALPNISGAAQYTRAIKKQVFFLPDFQNPSSGRIVPIEIGSDNSLQFGFTATQVLFNSAVFTGVGTAKVYQKAARELYRGSYNTTIANVKRAFYGVLFARKVLEMTRASMQNAEDNYRNVEIRNKQGIISDYDLIRAEVQVSNIRPVVLQRESAVTSATNGLKILLGIDPMKEIELQGELEFHPVEGGIVEQAEKTVLGNNANLKALEYQREVNQELISINRSEFLPTLAAFGNYQWQAQKNDFRISTADLIQSASVGLSLSISLFNGFQSKSRVGQSYIDFLKSDEQLRLSKDGMVAQVQTIRQRLEEAQKRIQVQNRAVEQAEKGFKIATTRYQSGSGTQLEVNDADLALMMARVNTIQAIYDYSVATADLEEALCLNQQ